MNKPNKPLTDKYLQVLGLRNPMMIINRNVFCKTEDEKLNAKNTKKWHKDSLREKGKNPKKQMNISEPTVANYRAE